MYRIYGLSPHSDAIDFDRYLSFIHPDDLQKVRDTIQTCLETHQPYDYYHRIVLRDGTVKIIHSKGEALLDKHGKPYKLVGTAQDATERQALMQNLLQSELLYKQAQAIAHIGNWTYIFSDKKMAWSDELYRIYGCHPLLCFMRYLNSITIELSSWEFASSIALLFFSVRSSRSSG